MGARRSVIENMESRDISAQLLALFDRQKFENEPSLAALIAQTQARCAAELSEDALLLVSAAGEASLPKPREDTCL